MDPESAYDFIIVGAGPAGCVLASRLAKAFPHFEILLIEAGGKNADPKHERFGERYWTFSTAPGYDWGYKTVPQEHLGGREIDYTRGKGLGGSSAINFCVYTRGASSDYDQWAEVVGDDSWSWKNILKRFQGLETFVSPLKEFDGLVDISAEAHGFDGGKGSPAPCHDPDLAHTYNTCSIHYFGKLELAFAEAARPLKVGISHKWDNEFGQYFEGVTKDYPKISDHNSGNPIGMAVCQYSATEGRRNTASRMFLSAPPTNLTMRVESAVERVIFKERTAVGVEISGEQIFAKREVILCAGAIDSPKILLLSGIGPQEDLSKLQIPTVQYLPGVGGNLQDHFFFELVTAQKPGTHHRSSYMSSPEAIERARKQWIAEETGPFSNHYLSQMIAYLRSDRVLHSEQFSKLDAAVRDGYKDKTKPNYELLSHCPGFAVQKHEPYLGTAVAFMGPQSSGTVTLRSTDPRDPPLIDPKFLSHPFDHRVAIECTRDALDFLDQPFLLQHRDSFVVGPKGTSDDEILDFAKSAGQSMWHMCGTVKMGKPDDVNACVDGDCRVRGVQGLRVVDMSVAPFVPSAHTQAVAYVVGATAAEKLIAEYQEQ